MLPNEEIIGLFKTGKTLAEIAKMCSVSRQRIHQITSSFGLRRSDGGAWLRETKREASIRKADDNHFRKYGITRSERRELTARYGNDLIHAFKDQKYSAASRKIVFLFSFKSWLDLWISSGHLHERGPSGYVMARFGDCGPYSVENVKIIPAGDNTREYHAAKQR